MPRRRDPIERAADDSRDLQEVSTWEPRSLLDRFAYGVYTALSYGFPAIVLLVALAITASILLSPAIIVAEQPLVSVFFLLSVVPAALLAAYIWYADITTREPLGLLVATFVLVILFAPFAAVINTVGGEFINRATVLGSLLFFFLIVGPVEEAVKLLAVRVYAYRSNSFDAVIDGAVYGAVAGLGFASIENAIYIGGYLTDLESGTGLFVAATEIATTRALAGPGHVIYSAIAGFYLGLAKFNPQNAGPLVVKGLLVAAFVHGLYNSTVQFVPAIAAELLAIGPDAAFVGFVVAFNAIFGYYLYRKIAHYRRTYRDVREDIADRDLTPERTEFEPAQR
ncbi:PrsW family glutamic-type intramembrane protease [Halostagnicola sp. A-GB9-2]|uniref:PrsW family intramembrane metalloprotease n=1 Tax=Halostagnicola sp. A-GB9-2 TaxID=3048066 RepID=UPI0024C05593|nr:PrsW family glutamic-type intramembrane protease [Halostagnicola sp. A-GB9-2]MDJ1432314.1 PrsW family glutamic-type intramembrane protease [Halostagnicola sp. A-GB9-2]